MLGCFSPEKRLARGVLKSLEFTGGVGEVYLLTILSYSGTGSIRNVIKQVHSNQKETFRHVTGSRCLWEDGGVENLQGKSGLVL